MIKIPSKGVYAEFKSIFDMDLAGFKDTVVMMAIGKFSFNILKFDDVCHKRFGYKEETHGSLNEFVKLKFGDKGSELIKNLLAF